MPLIPKRPMQRYASGCLSILISVAVLLTGCASLEGLLQKPTASFSSMNLRQADLLKSTAVFNFDVHNPNPVPILASRITYDLKLNGRHFISGDLDRGMTLAAGKTSRLQVPVTIQYLDLFDSLSQLWKTQGADYALTGGFAVGPFTIPFRAHGDFDLPKMPKMSLENVKIEQLSVSGARLRCRLKMDNPNAFALLLKRLDYQFSLGGISFSRASAISHGPIAANSAAMMNFGFDISFEQLGFSAYQLLRGADADYRLDGALVFDAANGKENKIPMRAAGRVPFSR